MKRVLVTGAQGFVGRYLVAELLEQNPDAEVVGIGRSAVCPRTFSYGMPLPEALERRLATHQARYRYARVSLDQLPALVRELTPDCVFHLASALHTAAPGELIRTNIEGTLSVVRALEGCDALLVHGSSGSVYGEPGRLPIPEEHPCSPANLYGLSKWTAEQVLALEAARSGLRHVSARIFNIVGPGQTPEHVCGRFAKDLLSVEGGGVMRVGPLCASRDFIDVRDVATALCVLARSGQTGRAYNVASGAEVSIREVLRLLVHASGIEARIEEGRAHSAGVSRQVADTAKLRALQWAPRHSLEQSLRDVLDHQRWCLDR